ncbi:MAG: hypothetical protein ABIQ04_04625 [Candidatus Saccharimonadales bacterium]
MKTWRWIIGGSLGIVLGILLLVVSTPVLAQAPGEFSLQVSPSPLVTTLKPGQTTDLELKIRNSGTAPEELTIAPRGFSLNDSDGTVKLNDTAPSDIDGWITFSNPSFTVQPGEWFTQKVRVAVPKDSGFSYSFALVINRKNNPQPTEGGRLIKGSVAVFTLINIDRPGAVRKLETTEFVASQNIYEYLPTELSIRFKNSGNTIVQPYGNIFIQQGSGSGSPIATLPVNETKGYILPGKERTLQASWNDGFPYYKVSVDTAGVQNKSLTWNFADIAKFRIGQYTAKLVGVYNDGQRDVPIESEITFWVIPWKAILMLIGFIIAVWFIGRKIGQRRTRKAVKKALEKQAANNKDSGANGKGQQ